jgi:pimeloyl-ACP methyl ester carboxylesterase
LGALKLHDAARVVAQGGRKVLPRIPATLWRLAVMGRGVHSPAAGLLALANTNTRLLLVCGPEDSYGYRTGGKADLRKMQRTSSIRLIWVDDLAHVPMARRQRLLVTQIMTDFLHEA